MATVTYIKERKQNLSAMRIVINYCMREDKTWDDQSQSFLISGVNCNGVNSILEFETTKAAHRKMGGTNFYQYVQSFSDRENITPQQGHALAVEFAAKAWPGAEVLVTTHCDTDNVHSHFVINSVLYESGLKLHQDKNSLKRLRKMSDQICQAHGFSVLKPYSGGGRKLSAREYRAAQKGESWKFRLMFTIGEAMKRSRNREDFVILMKRKGYDMVWTDTRKEITFLCPNGMKCRGSKLHHPKYLKENMEYEFEIRERYTEQHLSGRPDPEQRPGTGGEGGDPVPAGGVRHPGGVENGRDETAGGGGPVPAGAVPTDPAAGDHRTAAADAEQSAGAAPEGQRPDDERGQRFSATGWENERAEFYRSVQAALGQSQRVERDAGTDRGEDHRVHDRSRGDIGGLGRTGLHSLSALARLIDASIDDTDDPEEKRRRIQAKIEAENFGTALGLTIGVASVIADRLSERHQGPDQPEEPMDTDKPDEMISAEEPEQETSEQLTPEEPEENPASQLTPEELEALEILEQEEYNEYQAQSDLWQMTM